MYGWYISGDTGLCDEPRIMLSYADRKYADDFHGAIHLGSIDVHQYGSELRIERDLITYPDDRNIAIISPAGSVTYAYFPDDAFQWTELDDDTGIYVVGGIRIGTFRRTRQWRNGLNMESESMKRLWQDEIETRFGINYASALKQWRLIQRIRKVE
jgi:hypothetical protein